MSKLDLHGIRHHEVPRKVDVFLGEHLQKGTNEVTIITGHSDHMKKNCRRSFRRLWFNV